MVLLLSGMYIPSLPAGGVAEWERGGCEAAVCQDVTDWPGRILQ
jgi:hypothetical protein